MGTKRRHVAINILLCLGGLTCVSASLAVSQDVPPGRNPIDTFNYVLGTQTIGVKYQFTEATRLVETAARILDMGSNHLKISMNNHTSLVTDVLPFTSVDYVSYSSYDTINPHKGHVTKALHEVLDFIEARLPPKPGILGKRVFIGEYGFPLEQGTTPEKQLQYAQNVCAAALSWGCPFVLYWEMYCNEIKDGKHRGFWLVDDKNVKQPFYLWLETYYQQSRRFVRDFKQQHGRIPTQKEFTTSVLKSLTQP